MNFNSPFPVLVDWFGRNRRRLPWRIKRTPYSVWVSEIMLQQTTVSTVIPRFSAWMKKFSSIISLSKASERQVLREWEGLGYYSRARNLLRAARIIVSRNKGRLPENFEDLRKLPGIGEYTASAILSIAFNKPYPVVDANVKRVMARLFNRKINSAGFDVFLIKTLNAAIPDKEPGNFNEALMELGQLICSPRDPRCQQCPLSGFCRALKAGTQEQVLGRKKNSVKRLSTRVMILLNKGRVLLQRSDISLMRSLWKFPGIPSGGSVGSYLRRNRFKLLEKAVNFKSHIHHYTVHREELIPMLLKVRGRKNVNNSAAGSG